MSTTDKQTLSKKTLQEAVKSVMKELERLRAENADLKLSLRAYKQTICEFVDDSSVERELAEYLAWIKQ